MNYVPMKSQKTYDRNNLHTINEGKKQGIKNIQNIHTLNTEKGTAAISPSTVSEHVTTTPTSPAVHRSMPVLHNLLQKGQKIALEKGMTISKLKACFGWNTNNPQCDVDVSAYLLGDDNKVLGDNWFVFYGQEQSPDRSVRLQRGDDQDCQWITIDLQSLNPAVKKIVFVLTINEAFEKHLNFGMIEDAYVRILNGQTGQELTSFQMTEYYSNVISMMIGEVYNYNGVWKFNAIGNGVAKDLAGLCRLYGVQVED